MSIWVPWFAVFGIIVVFFVWDYLWLYRYKRKVEHIGERRRKKQFGLGE